jgi:hypothetical protein
MVLVLYKLITPILLCFSHFCTAMGSDCNPSKHHYDITMSKRTRRPIKVQDSSQISTPSPPRKEKEVVDEGDDQSSHSEDNDRKSLKQLINSRSSLGQHFTAEEKQLQIVTKKQQEGVQGLKLKKLVSRYAKVLSHMIKGGESRKKPHLLLKT